MSMIATGTPSLGGVLMAIIEVCQTFSYFRGTRRHMVQHRFYIVLASEALQGLVPWPHKPHGDRDDNALTSKGAFHLH
jgi:hypothetical protein